MFDLCPRTLLNIEAHRLLKPGETVLVAVSGGVDSMVLLQLMHELAREQKWKLVVAHFNHRLRGTASEADERLVRRTAKQLGLRCLNASGQVKKQASLDGLSVEMAARKLRHEFLARAAHRCGAQKIALAHHADDQLELFFLRLLRGAGSQGLSGMLWQNPSPADAKLHLVRPLLNIPKAWISACAKARKISFREDASNRSYEIMRNRIRHELLPLLRTYQPGLDRCVPRLMDILQAEDDFLDDLAQGWLEAPTSFDDLPLALQRRVVALQLLGLGVVPVFDLVEGLRSYPGLTQYAPGSRPCCRNLAGMISEVPSWSTRFPSNFCQVPLNEVCSVQFAGRQFEWETKPCRAGFSRPSPQTGVEWFDAEKVGATILLRHWRPGDRFHPIGSSQPVKLQDLFTNAKVPRAERHQRVVAETADGRIFWVEGLRISDCFKLDKGTRFALKWQWCLV